MTIKRAEDPFNGGEIVFAEGKVEQIAFKDITPADKFGNTHRAGVRVGDDWVNGISVKTKEGEDAAVRFNAGTQSAPNWTTLAVGDKVKIILQESVWEGKTYFNSGVSKIKLVAKGEGVPTKETASGGTVREPFKPRDMSGVEIGHALNGGLNLVRNGVAEDVVEASRIVHTITVDLKAEYAKKNPKMSDYDVGAMVGHATLNGTRDAQSFEDVEEVARNLLDNVVPLVSEFVKGDKKEPEAKATKTTKTEKPAPKPRKAKEAPQQETMEEEVAAQNLADMDDDIPF